MALSFFRKSRDKFPPPPAPVALAVVNAPVHAPDPDFRLDSGGIVVEEGSGAPQSALDEAAIQFASGQVGQAETTLKQLVAEGAAAGKDLRAWAMLFDLYCADSREADFEALALDYAVRFESSPPVWRARTAPTAAASDSRFDLPGLLSRTNADELAADLAGIAHDVPVTLDFSRVDTVDEGGADATTRLLETCRKQTRTLCLVGVERLLPLLADLLCATQSKPAHWLLLLTLYQLLGQEDDFENTAVDYAVRFEVSPPSWGAARPVESRPVDPRSQASAAPAKRNPHPLHGEITPDNDAALRTLVDQAAVGEVRVDLGEVTRFDYGSVSQLIGVLMDGLGQGKSVTFVGHNALIHELFRVMGIDQLATLEPRFRV